VVVTTRRERGPAELHTLLSAYPVGEQRPLWYDPRAREEPTFNRLTLGGVIVAASGIMLWPVAAIVEGILLCGRSVWRALTTARPEPTPETPVWRRLLLVVAALLTIGLTVRYLFRQDYRCYFEFERVMG
jgi:hypothetical protein